MDKYLQLIEELKESKEILENRKNKKHEKLNSLVKDNNIIINRKRSNQQKIVELYKTKKSFKEVEDSIRKWDTKAPKIKKAILAYGIFIIGSVLTSLGLYCLFPLLISIISALLTISAAISTFAVTTFTLKNAIPFLVTYFKNRKIICNNVKDEIEKEIKKYEKQNSDWDKSYERNEIKINNIAEKIIILEEAIKDIKALIRMASYERSEAVDLELDYNKEYTEKQKTSILNYSFNNSDVIKRIRIKEREIKNEQRRISLSNLWWTYIFSIW